MSSNSHESSAPARRCAGPPVSWYFPNLIPHVVSHRREPPKVNVAVDSE